MKRRENNINHELKNKKKKKIRNKKWTERKTGVREVLNLTSEDKNKEKKE